MMQIACPYKRPDATNLCLNGLSALQEGVGVWRVFERSVLLLLSALNGVFLRFGQHAFIVLHVMYEAVLLLQIHMN